MTEYDKEKYALFQSAINLLSGKQSSKTYHEVIHGLFNSITSNGLYSTESSMKFLSLLLNTWMKGIIRNYKLDRYYSEHFGSCPKSMLRELDLLAGFPDVDDVWGHRDYTITDYHLPEFLSIADDVKIIMKERGWIVGEKQ